MGAPKRCKRADFGHLQAPPILARNLLSYRPSGVNGLRHASTVIGRLSPRGIPSVHRAPSSALFFCHFGRISAVTSVAAVVPHTGPPCLPCGAQAVNPHPLAIMSPPLSVISSMATQKLLRELTAHYAERETGAVIALESVGGVDAARRVAAGEAFDAVVLGADALDKLMAAGHVLAGSRVDLVRSPVAVAVPAGAPRPALDSEAAVRQAVLAARTLGYSTGPSGVALARLFGRWGIADAVQAKLITPPPGIPVGALIARGEVELGFQQLSELMHLPGIDVLGPLPETIQITTTFSGGIAATSQRPDMVRALLAFLASADTSAAKRANGMEAA